MSAAVTPPLVAAVAAVALTAQRFVAPLLLELDVGLSGSASTHYTLAARFASFLLVYGVLLGVSYWVGLRDGDDANLLVVAAATFAVAAAAALVASVAVLQVLGWGTRGLFVAFAVTVGQSASTGVQLGVVAFAGLAAGSR